MYINSKKTGISFVDYIKTGGGVIVFQSANSAFPDWKEYHEIIGLGGWENRYEMPGNYLYWKENEFVTDTSQGYGKLFLKQRHTRLLTGIRHIRSPVDCLKGGCMQMI